MMNLQTTSEEGVIFNELDRHFARLMIKLDGREKWDFWLAAALTSNLTQKGHVCLDLPSFAGKRGFESGLAGDESATCPGLNEWVETLKSSPLVGSPGEFRPLILASNRLYLYRYWRYERLLADFLAARMGRICEEINWEILKGGLSRLFPPRAETDPDWQRIAAFTATYRMFTVITGGPGTGKTSTVVKILALLLEQARGKRMDIALVAPTGKAAARLKESVKLTKECLNCAAEIRNLIPEEALTLHRLLGSIPGSIRFRYDAKNPLPYDVVVVDEASMVDLPLMAKLTQAIPDRCRLILLGDKDQLASVEPGAVFGDICGMSKSNTFSEEFFMPSIGGPTADENNTPPGSAGVPPAVAAKMAALPGEFSMESSPARVLEGPIVVLQKNYRFGEGSGIAALSRAVNLGEVEKVLKILESNSYRDITWRDTPSPTSLESALEDKVREGYAPYLKTKTILEALELFGRFQILCVHRHGPYGVALINKLVESLLSRAWLIHPRGRWYKGQPIMITRNDYHLRLFNGDIGILFPDAEIRNGTEIALRAFFPSEKGVLQKVLPMRLPEHETVYAMTVHKSQGSEFEKVLLLLPDSHSEIITRELLYTAVTRAKMRLEIWGNKQLLLEAAARRIERTSGLREALSRAEAVEQR